jgi:hypothetical protein
MRAQRWIHVLLLSGCAHWGTSNVSDFAPELPHVASTYLAPVRPALPADAFVTASRQAPPPGSTVLAISKARCDSGTDHCLLALVDEAHRIGGTGLYGLHTETTYRVGTFQIGSIAFDPGASAPASLGRRTEVDLRPGKGAPGVAVFLERRDTREELPFWRLVCKLPCTADLDTEASYRLNAPQLADEPPLDLRLPRFQLSDRIQVTTGQGKPDYSRFWLGLGLTLVAGGVAGGTMAYYFANQGSPAAVAELTVGQLILPCLLYGILYMLEGPVNRVELATEPEG